MNQKNLLGIVPAAGEGLRWGGYFKELLPINDKKWLIDETINSMKLAGTTKFLVISNESKIGTHVKHLNKFKDINIYFSIQKHQKDIWGAIMESFPLAEEYNLFSMPDTYIPRNSFIYPFEKDFYLGVFKTKNTERFGILYNGLVVNKEKLPNSLYNAWGILVWSKNCVNFWLKENPETYTEAINIAIDNFGLNTFNIDFYYDFASWKDYKDFLKNEN
jgi:dTDP-glucose pyrophosphorylase